MKCEKVICSAELRSTPSKKLPNLGLRPRLSRKKKSLSLNAIATGCPSCAVISPPQRLKGFFFSGGVDPLSNLSAGTELQATAEGAGASARYHTQDGRHAGETVFSALLSGVACVPCVTVKMASKILRFSDV